MVQYSTGEVSKKLNISVRTIRYYDQIGLLVPSSKNESGKRLYSDDDLLMLEKITLLKSASLSLEDIRKIIGRISIERILELHKERLKADIRQMEKSFKHTNTLLNIIKLEGELRWDELMPLFQKTKTSSEDMWNSVFTEEEKELLTSSLPKLEDEPGNIRSWINIIKRIELCIAEGKSPNSLEGILIAEDMENLTKLTFGDNDLAEKFWEVRKSESESAKMGLYPIRQDVLLFVEEAMSLLKGNVSNKR
ncbi:MerR family transcriptional regulator [Bacillus sp. FJAT-22090]|uniref:MerR family transcriptional regulator n=1 Tax=Bacillus sp. FJAT-22090 TaxID=1581038 RepID=UPI0021B40408|nr:MerR family transcriptional regulator [Bacillus sp. FJAT-22090]